VVLAGAGAVVLLAGAAAGVAGLAGGITRGPLLPQADSAARAEHSTNNGISRRMMVS